MALTKITPEIVAVNAIQGTLIADNAITAVHIATNAVSGTLIADNAVTATLTTSKSRPGNRPSSNTSKILDIPKAGSGSPSAADSPNTNTLVVPDGF